MNDVRLNLARKWRSRDFDSIIGQSLSIRMLKNSLYLSNFFPVYLFSGQRGCGKTTTARVFAAAVNCDALVDFQQSPKQYSVPCGVCVSCQAMLDGKHPDFIEIDAASHTGVDNVRQIIEASSLLPLMGKKKIYLIDEAHMLSKAAFNAFLKILEEPPASVIFILATTDPHKIIETVRSRCFQLFFTSVSVTELQKHLVAVCESEKISYDEQALQLIIQESDGSVRDALNLLEQVRFSAAAVTKDAVLKSLGHLSDEQLLDIFDCILNKGSSNLLKLFSQVSIDNYSAEKFYGALVDLVRASLWVKHGIKQSTIFNNEAIEKIIASVPLNYLIKIFQLLCDYETVLTKTTKKHRMLEMLLLKMCRQLQQGEAGPSLDSSKNEQEIVVSHREERVEKSNAGKDEVSVAKVQQKESSPWDTFVTQVESLHDPLLKSIFVQATYESLDADGKLTVSFSQQSSFFSDLIAESSQQWLPLLQSAFGANVSFHPVFNKNEVVTLKKIEQKTEHKIEKKNEIKQGYHKSAMSSPLRPSFKRRGKVVDVSDDQMWRKTAMVLKHFPGTVMELEGDI